MNYCIEILRAGMGGGADGSILEFGCVELGYSANEESVSYSFLHERSKDYRFNAEQGF